MNLMHNYIWTWCRYKNLLIEQQNAHHNAADFAYNVKSEDKLVAEESNGSKVMCSFYIQQCLPTPALQISEALYKRQLWTYNLTISNNTDSETKCYM